MDRFWQKVTQSGECWNWDASKNPKGYGIFRYQGSTRLAHRVSYELTYGPIPDGAEVDHTCWNRSCVRPEHMRLTSRRANTQNRSGARSASKSGIRGVYLHASGRWQAQGCLQGKTKYLGLFDSPEEAGSVAAAWRKENMPDSLMDHEDQTQTSQRN